MTLNEVDEVVCDFCGAHWHSEARWYWVPYGVEHDEVVDYCAGCADALPKLIADLREARKLEVQ
jgi:hypothetical protein